MTPGTSNKGAPPHAEDLQQGGGGIPPPLTSRQPLKLPPLPSIASGVFPDPATTGQTAFARGKVVPEPQTAAPSDDAGPHGGGNRADRPAHGGGKMGGVGMPLGSSAERAAADEDEGDSDDDEDDAPMTMEEKRQQQAGECPPPLLGASRRDRAVTGAWTEPGDAMIGCRAVAKTDLLLLSSPLARHLLLLLRAVQLSVANS